MKSWLELDKSAFLNSSLSGFFDGNRPTHLRRHGNKFYLSTRKSNRSEKSQQPTSPMLSRCINCSSDASSCLRPDDPSPRALNVEPFMDGAFPPANFLLSLSLVADSGQIDKQMPQKEHGTGKTESTAAYMHST